MNTQPVKEEFLRLMAQALRIGHDPLLIDRLTTAGGYSQLVDLDPNNDEYLRKFRGAVNELRLVLGRPFQK